MTKIGKNKKYHAPFLKQTLGQNWNIFVRIFYQVELSFKKVIWMRKKVLTKEPTSCLLSLWEGWYD